jgi:hypothetical protein
MKSTSDTWRASVRRRGGLVSIVLLALACTGPSPRLDPTGILLVGVGEQVQARPPNEQVGQAYSDAVRLAEVNGNDIGYPWIDPASGDLILSAATPKGRQLLEAAAITIPHRIRDVAHGASELRRIQDDVTVLGSRGVVGAELLFMTGPDHRDNRVLIGISAMSRPLLEYLAAHYPVDALAVQVSGVQPGGGTT